MLEKQINHTKGYFAISTIKKIKTLGDGVSHY